MGEQDFLCKCMIHANFNGFTLSLLSWNSQGLSPSQTINSLWYFSSCCNYLFSLFISKALESPGRIIHVSCITTKMYYDRSTGHRKPLAVSPHRTSLHTHVGLPEQPGPAWARLKGWSSSTCLHRCKTETPTHSSHSLANGNAWNTHTHTTHTRTQFSKAKQ